MSISRMPSLHTTQDCSALKTETTAEPCGIADKLPEPSEEGGRTQRLHVAVTCPEQQTQRHRKQATVSRAGERLWDKVIWDERAGTVAPAMHVLDATELYTLKRLKWQIYVMYFTTIKKNESLILQTDLGKETQKSQNNANWAL